MATIFLDMDGVIADFDKYAKSLLGYSTPGGKRYPIEDWAVIKQDPRFYRKLEVCPQASELVAEVNNVANAHGYDVKFLTAIPRANDVPWCFQDKVEWAQQHFPSIPVWFGPFSNNKHVHCNLGDVLIDDRDDNVNDWNLAGGKGILHQGDVPATLAKLHQLM